MCYFKSLVNEHKILVSLFRFIRGPVNKNNWLFPRLATKQSMGKVSLLTWHSDWFLRLSASVMIGQWHRRYLHIKVRKNAASRLGIPIGSFDWLHLLTVVKHHLVWFRDLYTSIKGTISGFFDITLKPYELIAIKEIPERMVQFYFKMMFNCV